VLTVVVVGSINSIRISCSAVGEDPHPPAAAARMPGLPGPGGHEAPGGYVRSSSTANLGVIASPTHLPGIPEGGFRLEQR
jgi:hypothetical protein